MLPLFLFFLLGFQLLLVSFDDHAGHVRWHNIVVIQFHSEIAATAGDGAQLGRISQHLRHGHVRNHNRAPMLGLGALNAPAPGIEIAHYIAHVRIRHSDPHAHNRLKQHGTCILHCQLKGFPTCNLKCNGFRIDRVLLAIVDDDPDVAHRIAGERPLVQAGLDALFNRRQVGAREVHTHQLVGEFKIGTGQRFNAQMHFTELARAAGLLLVAVLGGGFLRDALAIGNLRLMRNKAYLEFRLGTMDGCIDVLIAHALEHRFSR